MRVLILTLLSLGLAGAAVHAEPPECPTAPVVCTWTHSTDNGLRALTCFDTRSGERIRLLLPKHAGEV